MVSEIPTVDFTCFGDGTLEARQEAARALRDACTRLGAVHLTGIGLPEDRLHEAFAWSKKLFDLSMEDKMKAPHPPTAMPHRGYSGPGLEKVYSKAERDQDEAARRDGATLRKIEDFKVRDGLLRPESTDPARRATKSAARRTRRSPTSGSRRLLCRDTATSPWPCTKTCMLLPCGFSTRCALRSS